MALTDYVIMPGEDYQAICDAVRAKTGKTDLLKSGDVDEEIAGIKTEPILEDITVIPSTERQAITASDGNDGLREVIIEAAQLETIEISPAQEDTTYTPTDHSIGFSDVNVKGAKLQSKRVDLTICKIKPAPGDGNIVRCDDGHYGLESVRIPYVYLCEKTVRPSGEEQIFEPTDPQVGFWRVTAAAAPLQDKQIDPSEDDTEVVCDDGNYGLGTVIVKGAKLQEKTCSPSDTEQTIVADDGNYGLKSVVVDGAKLQDKTIPTYIYLLPEDSEPPSYASRLKEIRCDDGYYGLGTIFVNEIVLQQITVTPSESDQIITPRADTSGFREITVMGAKLDELVLSPSAEPQIFTAEDHGVYGFNRVYIDSVKLQNKIVEPSSESIILYPDEGFHGLGEVIVKGLLNAEELYF